MNEPEGSAVLNEQQIDLISDALIARGYVLLNEFLPEPVAQDLLTEIYQLSDNAFKPAAIGRDNLQQLNEHIRSNTLHWLSGDSPAQQHYLAAMEQLRLGINQRLFMGLFDFEGHYSHYAPGDFYKRHVDAFKGASNRVLSSVLYLNPDWHLADAGELVLYQHEQSTPVLRVEPKFNHMVLFLSTEFPHEVLATKSDRYCIAGWFRINGSVAGQLDPPM